jgi:hypothetical protein
LNQTGTKLTAAVVEPKGFTYQITPYSNYQGAYENVIKVSTPVKATTAKFLTVLYTTTVRPIEEVQTGNLLGVIVTPGTGTKDLVLFSSDGNPVDQYVELNGYYQATDGRSYTFDGTKIRTQFNTYQVISLEQITAPTPTPTPVTPTPTPTPTATPTPTPTSITGDANEDGIVNSTDLTKVERIIMMLDPVTSSADVNADGNINALDLTQIELTIMNG